MRVALDTNILAYAEGLNGAPRRAAALDILERLPSAEIVIPVQVLGELFNVLVRKGSKPRRDARDAIVGWMNSYDTMETSLAVMSAAAHLAQEHQLAIWDSVIVAAASQAGCRLLLSEDLQSGFNWAGVTVVNPFASPRQALLEGLLQPPTRR